MRQSKHHHMHYANRELGCLETYGYRNKLRSSFTENPVLGFFPDIDLNIIHSKFFSLTPLPCFNQKYESGVKGKEQKRGEITPQRGQGASLDMTPWTVLGRL